MKRFLFTLLIICITNLFSIAQQSFALAKGVENAQVKSLEYNGVSDGFVIYNYKETNGTYKYTFNIFDKNLNKLVTKSYPYPKGTQVYQFISNRNSFCLVMGNTEKKAMDIYTYDKKGKRIGKKAINSNSVSKIAKIVKAMESKRLGKDVKGMDLFAPKVVAAEEGYFILTQNAKLKEGYEIQKVSSKLRKEWIKTVLPNDKEIISFGSLQQNGDNLAVISVLREKLAEDAYEMKLDIYKGKEEEATISYELEEDGNALFPNQMNYEADNSLVIAGVYYGSKQVKANTLDGVFVLKIDESGEQEFVNLISWDDKLKKIAKSERSSELKYVVQEIVKQNKYYNLVLELFKTTYTDVTDYSKDDKKNKSYELMLPFCRSLGLMLVKTDYKSGELNKAYAIKKEDTYKKMSDFTLTESELMLDMMFTNPDYFSYHFKGMEGDSPYFIHNASETAYSKTIINKAGKPSTKAIELENSDLFIDNEFNGVFQLADNQAVVYSFDEDESKYNYWTENFSDAYKIEMKKKAEAAKLAAEKKKEAEEKKKMEAEAKAKAIADAKAKAKVEKEKKEALNKTAKTESKKTNTTAKKETTAKKAVSSKEKLDENAVRKARMELLRKKLAEKRKEALEKEKE